VCYDNDDHYNHHYHNHHHYDDATIIIIIIIIIIMVGREWGAARLLDCPGWPCQSRGPGPWQRGQGHKVDGLALAPFKGQD
jgi:hypothetical protein